MARTGGGSELIPAVPSRAVQRAFAWYAERILRGAFAAVRLLRESEEVLAELAVRRERPALLALSHCSWWDPIIAALLWRRFAVGRPVAAPMDARELARLRFLRRIGLFGLDPDAPESLTSMRAYLDRVLQAEPTTLIMLTPQGRLTDPREPIRLRPGAAAIASRYAPDPVVALSIEYAFWTDRKPEVFLRAGRVRAPQRATTSAWHVALSEEMTEGSERLAAAVRGRDPARFEALMERRGGTQPVYDFWLRLTGRATELDTAHRSSASLGRAS